MNSPFAGASFSAAAWALTYLLHSTLFLGGTWIALRLARGASHRVRDRVWKLALFAGLATATLQVGLGLEPLGGRFALQGDVQAPPVPATPTLAPDSVEDRDSYDAGARPHAKPASRSTREQDASFPVHLVRASGSPERQRASHSTEPVSAETPPRPRRDTARPILAAISTDDAEPPAEVKRRGLDVWAASFSLAWAFGIALSALALCSAVLRLERGLRGRRRLRSGEAVLLLADLARRAGLSRDVELAVSDDLATPVTFGLIRPKICVPARALADLPRDQLEAMLAHELGHAVRRDPLWQFVARAIASALFFQPLNRIAAAELADSAEYLSDDWAVAHTGRRLSLASCLTEVATWIVGARRALPTPAMTDGKHRLGRRVHRLLEEGERSTAASTDRFAFLCAAVLTSGVLVVPGFASSADALPRGPSEGSASGSEAATHERSEFESAVSVADRMEPKPNAIETVLSALDGQIALLEEEVGALRAAILGLDEPDELLESVQIIERRIAELHERREAFALELPRLAQLLSRRERESNSH